MSVSGSEDQDVSVSSEDVIVSFSYGSVSFRSAVYWVVLVLCFRKVIIPMITCIQLHFYLTSVGFSCSCIQ